MYQGKNDKGFVSCNDDKKAVLSLPIDWVPRSGGLGLKKYLEEKTLNHEETTREMEAAADASNKEIEAKVETITNILKTEINKCDLDTQCLLDKYKSDAPITKDTQIKAVNEIKQFMNNKFSAIEDFKNEGLRIERERGNCIKDLLKEYLHRFINIGHVVPKELKKDFENRIFEANQQLISNCRVYDDMSCQLKIIATEEFMKAKARLNELVFTSKIIDRPVSATKISSQEPMLSYSRWSSSTSCSVNPTYPVLKQKPLQVTEKDQYIARVIEIYNTSIAQGYNKLSYHIKHINKERDFKCLEYFDPKVSEVLHKMIERISPRIATSDDDAPEKCLDIWNLHTDLPIILDSLNYFNEAMRNTYLILRDTYSLADAHMMRLGLAQKLTMASLDELMANNDRIQSINEVEYSVVNKNIATCSDANKIVTVCKNAASLFDRTAELYKRHYEAELAHLDQFRNLITPLTDVLKSEIGMFLQNHSMACSCPAMESSIHNSSQIYQAFLKQLHENKALLEFNNACLEKLDSNLQLIEENVQNQASKWIESRANFLRLRHAAKTISHSVRVETVNRCSANRLAVLDLQARRIASHVKAFEDLEHRLLHEASNYLSLEAPELYPLCDWIDRTKALIEELSANETTDLEVKRLKMSSYKPRVYRYRKLFEQSLIDAIAACEKKSERLIGDGVNGNEYFLSQIKLFYENGTYSAAEAMKDSSEISKMTNQVKVSIDRLGNAFRKRQSELLVLADKYMEPVLILLGEISPSSVLPGKKKKKGLKK